MVAPTRALLIAWVILIVLTVTSVAVGEFARIGGALLTLLVMAIATIKGP
jgi:hypothetical protein